MRKLFVTLLMIPVLVFSSAVLAADPFWQVGRDYLFIPRLNVVMKGTVVEVTEHEIVFTDRYIVSASRVPENIDHTSDRSAQIKSSAVAQYFHSQKREKLLEPTVLKDTPVAYSRANLTGILIK